MFSIVIPLYNKAPYIGKCLQSVINQTLQDFEVIVINDGSSDDGADKVQKLIGELSEGKIYLVEDFVSERSNIGEDVTSILNTSEKQIDWVKTGTKNVKIRLINQENCGVSVARNNGVRLAKFDYIAFLDADDWWDPSFLEEMRKLIEDFPEAGIYGSNYSLVKNRIKRPANIALNKDFKKGTIDYCRTYTKNLWMPLWTGATIIPKRIFDSENGFKSHLKLGEDFDLWIRVALKHPVAFLNKTLAYYNQDIQLTERAVGQLHNPDNHILFNLDPLDNDEKANPSLKQLLDNLRVYGLFSYYCNSIFHNRAKQELKKVDWTKQPLLTRLKYKSPLYLIKFWVRMMTIGSFYKQKYLALSNKIR